MNSWNGPYLEQLPADPWGRPYVYHKIDDKNVLVESLGADGVPGGSGENADISNRDDSSQTGG
ncbi:MAG: type II secretion system protein GspG [Fimbriimonadales bacterium]